MRYLISTLLICLSVHSFSQINNSFIKDNWFDKNGNWVLTIANNKIIYKNQPWNYTVEKQSSDNLICRIMNGMQTKKIQFAVKDSSTIEFYANSANKENITLTKKRFTKVPIQNNPVRYSPEVVTINGYIKNFDKKSESTNVGLSFSDWLTGRYRELFAPVDSTGCFKISFVQYQPQEFTIVYRKKYIRLFIIPGDTLTMGFDAKIFPKNVLLMGKHADIAYNMADYETYSGNRITRNSIIEQKNSHNLDTLSYKVWRDSLQEDNLNYISNYTSTHATTDFFKKWLPYSIKYDYITELCRNYTSKSYIGRAATTSKFYLSLLDSINFTDSTAMTCGNLYTVMNAYNNIFDEMAGHRPESKGVKKDFAKHYTAAETNAKNPTASNVDKNGNVIKQDISNQTKINRPEPRLISKTLSASADEYITEVKSVKNDLLRDALTANCYRRFKNYYDPDTLYQKIQSNVKNDIVKGRFDEEFKLEMSVNSNEYIDPNSEDEGIKLLNNIINKHKGKVLYVDFWGMHCGPCLQEFTYTKLKEYYAEKKKNVVFVYLCERGDKENWQGAINKYHVEGDHYLLNEKQVVGLTKLINLTYVPRYIIIDRKGKIVNYDAPRPRPTINMELKFLIDKCL